MSLETRVARIEDEITQCCKEAGRDRNDVQLLAVSKTVDIPAVEDAMHLGLTSFGENRPDEILRKTDALPQADWHFIGNVQSRRIPDIVSCASLIHSVFKESHLSKIDAAAAHIGKVQNILIELNVSGEASKSGIHADGLPHMLECASQFEHICVRGLMTMAPQGDLEVARKTFAALASVRDSARELPIAQKANINLDELSMGMSEDWKCAIAEGATIIRIGRAIFSDDFD